MNTYPIDFECLQKGQVLSFDQIEHAIGVARDSPKWPFALMNLRDRIHNEREDLVCKIMSEGIAILSDSEAATHTAKRFEISRRGMFRNHALGLRVNDAGLTDEERKHHAERMTRQGSYLAALRSVRRVSGETQKQLLDGRGEDGIAWGRRGMAGIGEERELNETTEN